METVKESSAAAAKQERRRFLGFSFALADLLVELDGSGRVTFAAGACQHLLGMRDAAVQGRSFLDLVAAGDRPLVRQLLLQLARMPRIPPMQVALQRPDGSLVQIVLSAYTLPGDAAIYVGIAVAERFRPLAGPPEERDPRTGLHTAQGLAARLRALTEEGAEPARELTMTFMELEGLEDLQGPGSETVVEEVAAFLRVRSYGHDTAGWLEGGRFGLVTEGEVDPAALAADMRTAVPEARGLTASVHSRALQAAGVSPEVSARTLIYALQRFQSEGLSEEVQADPAVQFRNLLDRTLGDIERFQDMIDGDRILLAYQPIVELATGKVHHHEVLARLPSGGSPFESVTLGESIGLIPAFDLTICRKALADLHAAGPNGGLRLAVNLSAQSLQDATFVDSLVLMMERHTPLLPNLSFEVTESSAIRDLAATNEAIQRLRRLGCSVALDDFGSGNASFRYLQTLEVDCVKIDGSYVRAIVESPRDRALVKGIVEICRELGLSVVAEMIESEREAKLLTQMGVTLGQGYLFGRPELKPHAASAASAAPSASAASAAPSASAASRAPRMLIRKRGTRETWG